MGDAPAQQQLHFLRNLPRLGAFYFQVVTVLFPFNRDCSLKRVKTATRVTRQE